MTELEHIPTHQLVEAVSQRKDELKPEQIQVLENLISANRVAVARTELIGRLKLKDVYQKAIDELLRQGFVSESGKVKESYAKLPTFEEVLEQIGPDRLAEASNWDKPQIIFKPEYSGGAGWTFDFRNTPKVTY